MNVDKASSRINAYPLEDPFRRTHKWNVNGKEIKLFLSENENFITISDKTNLVRVMRLTKERAEDINLNDQIYLHKNGQLEFCSVLFKTKFKKVELSLLLSEDGVNIYWQLFDRVTKETNWKKNISATFVSDACHRETWDLFEEEKEMLEQVKKDPSELESFKDLWKDNIEKGILGPNDFDFFKEYFVTNYIKTYANTLKNEYIVKDIVILEEMNLEEENKVCDNIDGESIAEGKSKKACNLKKAKAWEESLDRTSTFKDSSFLHFMTNSEDIVIYGGTEKRIKFEENEKKYALYDRIISYPWLSVRGYRQHRRVLSSYHVNTNLLVSEKIKPIVDNFFPFFVVLEPITIPCTLDNNVQISSFRGAVAIINSGTGCCGQHALVFIQLVKNGAHYTVLSHLRAQNDIDIKDSIKDNIDLNKIKDAERTEVWLVSVSKIITMLKEMGNERDAQNAQFSIFGSYSPLSGGGNNCFTWAHSHLKRIGIDLGWPGFGFFYTQTKSYTQKPEYYLQKPGCQHQKI